MAEDVLILKEYLLNHIIKGQKTLGINEKIFSTGLVDSFGTLDLLFYIKEQFGVNIEDYELVDKGIDTAEELLDFINEKNRD